MAKALNICLVLPNWIGDAVMATPTLRAISRHFGDQAQLTAVMRPYVAQVLEGAPWINRRIFYDPHSRDPQLQSSEVVDRLRKSKVDTVVLLTNSLRTGLLAWRTGARQRVGYRRSGRGFLLTHAVSPPRRGRSLTPISAVDYYLELARQLGCTTMAKRVELTSTRDGETQADAVWERLRWGQNRDVLVLCPAGVYGQAKHWPSEHFAAVAQRMIDRLGCYVLVTCGPAERHVARRIVDLTNRPHAASLADQPVSVALSKACIRRSRLVISTDSGPRHIAAGFSVPTVALFGPTDPRWSLNYNPHELRLQKQLACSPCAKRSCRFQDNLCMVQLSPDRVCAAAQLLWEGAGRVHAA